MTDLVLPTLAAMSDVPPAYYLAPVGGVLALVMAKVFQKSVMSKSEGSDDMIEIAQAVRDGAMAYLTRQYKVVAGVFVLLIAFLGIMYALNLQSIYALIGVPVAGLFSGLCGWFGMKMATNASARTTHAVKNSLNEGLTVAFRSGAVMGLNVVGFALIDVSAWFFVFNQFDLVGGGITEITTIMLTFGMGASTQALFARVGGGIYTKAADVGADLVGKVEAGIPEDDARNPATIADNVGDNVGDVAGMGADLYESYYGSILATMALGAAAAMTLTSGDAAGALGLKLAVAPMALAGLGIFCSIAGIFAVKAKENATFSQLLKGLHKGVYVASALIMVGAFALLWFIFNGATELDGITTWWGLGLSIGSGLVSGLVIASATEYYTSYEHAPTKRIAEQALTGPATVIIAGIAEGMKSTWASLLVVVVAIIAAFSFAGGGDSFLMGLYGVGIAAVGMLSTLGITLATDAYGPIADNAGGNAEMTGQEPIVRERTDMLDSLGNTTAATGKGFAIGSAALTAMALFAAYIQIVQVQIGTQATNYYGDGTAFVEPEGSELGFAVHQGYGKFAVVTPNPDGEGEIVDGGMLLDVVNGKGHHSSKIQGLEKGDVIALTANHDSRYEIAGEGWNATLASTKRGRVKDVLAFYDVTLANPKLLGGIFIGVLLAFLFCALTMNAVGRAAYAMMGECRRQFGFIRQALRNEGMSEEDVANPDNWPMKGVDLDGHHYPDYAECVSISTTSAQKEMVIPSVLAIAVPILVGLTLSVAGVMGMLVGGLTSGFALAVFMANAGGAWDNAKKLLESYGPTTAQDMVDGTGNSTKIPDTVRSAIMDRATEALKAGNGDLIVYGKGSDDHKATVVGDTVGDPFKDTSGPALNILIKLISIVSVVFAGLIVAYGDILGNLIGLG
ncbi:MAG: K(+)-stimulated pyrophosphate-energized sodium pump [Phycisphaerales bacterium]|jgi:K(+)-stimulated pyrophosphate-energized sodium pump